MASDCQDYPAVQTRFFDDAHEWLPIVSDFELPQRSFSDTLMLEPGTSSRSKRHSKGYADLLLDCLRKRHAEYRMNNPDTQPTSTNCPSTSQDNSHDGCEDSLDRKKQRRCLTDGWHVTRSGRKNIRLEERAKLDTKSLSLFEVMMREEGTRSNGCSTSNESAICRGRVDAASSCYGSRDMALDSADGVRATLPRKMDASTEAIAMPETRAGKASATDKPGRHLWRLSNADVEYPNSQDSCSAMQDWDDVIRSLSAGGKKGGYLKVVSNSVLRHTAAQAEHGASSCNTSGATATVPPQLSCSSADSDDGLQVRVEEQCKDGRMPDNTQGRGLATWERQ